MRVLRGLPEHLRAAAAALYWEAFGGKLGRVLGPEARAQDYLRRAIAADHAIVALAEDGALVGLVGFKSPQGAFADGSMRLLCEVYGWPGGVWRGVALGLLAREVDNRRFLIDGLCVARAARGQGVGTALIGEILACARERAYREVRLDVISTNVRARTLYERLGFRAVRTERLGLLRHLFGFEAATTMVRPVDAAPA
jgi:ribosomal protein S18 acetylase RimI-like enzyme